MTRQQKEKKIREHFRKLGLKNIDDILKLHRNTRKVCNKYGYELKCLCEIFETDINTFDFLIKVKEGEYSGD